MTRSRNVPEETSSLPNPWVSFLVEVVIAIGIMVGAYAIFPVFVHTVVFSLYLHLPFLIIAVVTAGIGWGVFGRYAVTRKASGTEFSVAVGAALLLAIACTLGAWVAVTYGLSNSYLAEEAKFTPLDTMPIMDSQRVRYMPEQVAGQEIVRRAQMSQFTPGRVNAIGTEHGIVYIAPLVVQGAINMIFAQNQDFMQYDDAAPENERVSTIHTAPWTYGEDMEFFDNMQRQLILNAGFFHAYTSNYYAVVEDEAAGTSEVIGVFPYLAYHLRFPGVFIPHWGGVAVVHADGRIENFTPEQALNAPELKSVDRLFPRTLARLQVEAQRYDQGWYSGYIRRNDKIEVPELPGDVQMPFYLPMKDGLYSYVTMVEPDGGSFALRKIFVTDARTGLGSVYAVPTDQNILGPDKAMSYAKAVQGYNWYEEHGEENTSGSYRITEPRPVYRSGRLHYMYSITPVDYASVVATVFVDAASNDVAGPFKTREEVSAWLRGASATPAQKTEREHPEPISTDAAPGVCANLQVVCEQMKAICP